MMSQVSQASPERHRGDPGPVYWASAAATACAAAAPLPCFWVPPPWVASLLAPPRLPALAVLGTVLRGLEPEEGRTVRTRAGCPHEARSMTSRTHRGRVPPPVSMSLRKGDVEMRSEIELGPLPWSSVGFDRALDVLWSATQVKPTGNHRSYDVERTGGDAQRVKLAAV